MIPDTGGACVLVSGGAKMVWEELVVTDPRGFRDQELGRSGPPCWRSSLGDFSRESPECVWASELALLIVRILQPKQCSQPLGA